MKYKQHLMTKTIALIFLVGSLITINHKKADPFIKARVTPFALPAISDEPRFNSQFHFQYINRQNVFDLYQGAGVTVAVIDSGINIRHEDFWDGEETNILDTSAYIEERGEEESDIKISSVSDYGLSIVSDDNPDHTGHGTTVAGTIGAMINGVGTAGVSPGVNLMVLKTNYYFTEIEAAIRYAADHGADIINMSIGAYAEDFTDGFDKFQEGIEGADTYFSEVIDYAHAQGVTMIAAAGNQRTDVLSYPAANDHVIGVGALAKRSDTSLASYSNFGLGNVDLVAPGTVYVAGIGGATKYREIQGTSFAAPIVASAAALFKEANPTATPDEIAHNLKRRTTDLGDYGIDETFGHGRLDLERLLIDVPATGVSLNPQEGSIAVGQTLQLKPEFSPSNATNNDVIFTSLDESIATVSEETGIVTGVNPGTTTISVLTDDGGFTDTMSITITPAIHVTGISVDPTIHELFVDETYDLTYTITPEDATFPGVNFTSSDEAVATVSNTGQITALSPGTSKISVITVDGNFNATLSLTVKAIPVFKKTLTLDTSNFKQAYTYGEDLDLDHLTAVYSNEHGVPINLTGHDLTVARGNTKTLGESEIQFNYDVLSVNVPISVTNIGATPEITPEDFSLGLSGDSFYPALESRDQDPTRIDSQGFSFTGSKLRQTLNTKNLYIGSGGHFQNTSPFYQIKSLTLKYLPGGGETASHKVSFSDDVIYSKTAPASGEYTTASAGASVTVNAPAGSSYFRIDVSSQNLQVEIIINYQTGGLRYTEEERATDYLAYFLAVTAAELSLGPVTVETWMMLMNEFNGLSDEGKAYIETVDDPAFWDRYQQIIQDSGYENFLKPARGSKGGIDLSFQNLTLVTTIPALLSVLVSIVFIFKRKR